MGACRAFACEEIVNDYPWSCNSCEAHGISDAGLYTKCVSYNQACQKYGRPARSTETSKIYVVKQCVSLQFLLTYHC